jgi:hypothetical protein
VKEVKKLAIALAATLPIALVGCSQQVTGEYWDGFVYGMWVSTSEYERESMCEVYNMSPEAMEKLLVDVITSEVGENDISDKGSTALVDMLNEEC